MSTAQLEKPLRIGPQSNGMLMTPREFDRSDFDPAVDDAESFRYELICGVLVVSPKPGPTERSPNDWLGHLIWSYHEDNPDCIDDTLPEQTIHVGRNRRVCDRAIWCGLGRLPNTETEAPTIAVELVGQRSRDRKRDYEEKPREYKAAGVVEYWIIDRFQRTMTVHRRGRRPVVLRAGDVYRTDLLPGFELNLDEIFAKADRHAKPARKRRRNGAE